jgi:hypothetical protein
MQVIDTQILVCSRFQSDQYYQPKNYINGTGKSYQRMHCNYKFQCTDKMCLKHELERKLEPNKVKKTGVWKTNHANLTSARRHGASEVTAWGAPKSQNFQLANQTTNYPCPQQTKVYWPLDLEPRGDFQKKSLEMLCPGPWCFEQVTWLRKLNYFM